MRRSTSRRGICVAMLVLLLCTYAPAAWAGDFGAIGGSPATPQKGNERSEGIFIFTLKPGEAGQNGVRVDNYQKDERTVILSVVDSIASNDGSFACRQDAEKKREASTWVKLENSKVAVPAGGNVVVPFIVTVPKGAVPGEHDACITLQDTQNFATATGKAGIQLGFRIAIRLAIQVPGKIIKQLSIKGVQTSRTKEGTYSVTPVAHNSGNVSLDVGGRAQLFGLFGMRTKIVTANYSVLQGSSMKWPYTFKPIFWGGFYKARVSLTYNANVNDGIGVDSNNQRKKVSAESKYFFVIPDGRAIAVELAIPLLLLYMLVASLRRRYKQKTAHKRMAQYIVRPEDTITSVANEYALKWKRLAKINNLKAPYLLSPGQVLVVPKLGQKTKRTRRRNRRDDWVLEDSGDDNGQAPQSRPLAPPQNDWVSPREAMSSPRYNESPQNRYPTPLNVPASTAYSEQEEEYDDTPDWREGASRDELAQLGVLSDSTRVPHMNDSWDIDRDQAAAPEKVETKKPRRTRKSTTKRAKKPKKGA